MDGAAADGVTGTQRNARIRADARLSKQSIAQFAAGRNAGDRRRFAAGVVRLPAEGRGDRDRRRVDVVVDAKVYDRYARHVALQYAERLQLACPSRRHHYPDDFQWLSDRQQDPPSRERRAGAARDVTHDRTIRAAQRGERSASP